MFVVALPFLSTPLVSRKPPSNQPQVTPFAFSRSPMFLSVLDTSRVDVSRVSQMSPVGCGSPITVLLTVTAVPNEVVSGVKPCVWPETRLSAPTDDGPNVVSNELSLIAKFCA